MDFDADYFYDLDPCDVEETAQGLCDYIKWKSSGVLEASYNESTEQLVVASEFFNVVSLDREYQTNSQDFSEFASDFYSEKIVPILEMMAEEKRNEMNNILGEEEDIEDYFF